MQVVIDIPKANYEKMKTMDEKGALENPYLMAIAQGTPLPKGHGRLIDADRLKREIFIIDSYSEESVKKQITDAQTIIEADRSERSDKE